MFRFTELRGVHFSEVEMYWFCVKINRGQVICPLYSSSPLFRWSVIRGFYCITVIMLEQRVSMDLMVICTDTVLTISEFFWICSTGCEES